MTYYARSRFAPKPRPVALVAAPARTVGDGQDPEDIVCIRIRAHGYAVGGRIRHTIECFNDRHQTVLLSRDPAREIAEREQLLAAVFEQFPGIDWDRSHQVLIGPDGATVWAVPDVDERGFLPDEDKTFGALKPPTLVADRGWFDTITTMPARRAA